MFTVRSGIETEPVYSLVALGRVQDLHFVDPSAGGLFDLDRHAVDLERFIGRGNSLNVVHDPAADAVRIPAPQIGIEMAFDNAKFDTPSTSMPSSSTVTPEGRCLSVSS